MLENATRVGTIEDDFGEHRRVGHVQGGRPVRFIPNLAAEMTEINDTSTSFRNRSDAVFQRGEIIGRIYQNGPFIDAPTIEKFHDQVAEFKALPPL